jgi:hypothetical protein
VLHGGEELRLFLTRSTELHQLLCFEPVAVGDNNNWRNWNCVARLRRHNCRSRSDWESIDGVVFVAIIEERRRWVGDHNVGLNCKRQRRRDIGKVFISAHDVGRGHQTGSPRARRVSSLFGRAA